MSFEYHLKRKKLSADSITTYQKALNQFLNWLDDLHLSIDNIHYNHIINFIDYCRSRHNVPGTIQQKITAIKYYCDYRMIQPNPCHDLIIKTKGKPLPSPLLTEVQINHIYNTYPHDQNHLIRNKLIIGLVCYQALTTKELHRLTIDSIRLDHNVILIKKTNTSNGRSILIHQNQINIIQTYLDKIRIEILDNRPDDSTLIIHSGHNKKLTNILASIKKQLRELHSEFNSFRQLRASTISNWLKNHNLRQVQYMAGHKYLSSTERYQENAIEALQKQLDDLHPLK